MSVILANSHGGHEWVRRKHPPCLETRIQFFDYGETRAFLDRLAELSDREGLFPDLSFGTNYVNITIRPPENAAEVDARGTRFAALVDEILKPGSDTPSDTPSEA